MLRYPLQLFVGLLVLLMLTACQVGTPTVLEPEITTEHQDARILRLWTHEFPTFSAALEEKWIPEFEALHPNVRVEYQTFPYSGGVVTFDSKVLAEVTSGGGPDVWAMASHNFTQAGYLESGLLAPLDPHVFGYESVEDILSDYPENSLSVFVKDGELYALLNELTTLCLFYNKNVFDEVNIPYPSEETPMSWPYVGEISQAMLQTNPDTDQPTRMGYQFGFFANYPAPEWYTQNFYPVMRQYGQDDLFINDYPAGDSDAVINGLQLFYDFTHSYRAYDPYFAPDWFSDFSNDRVAMLTAGPWFTSVVRDINPEVRFGVAPHPVVKPSDSNTYQNIMYSFGWVVNANIEPEQQKLAQEFLAYILGKKGEAEQPLYWLETVGVLQPRTAFIESPVFLEILSQDPWLNCFIETFNTFNVDYYQHSSDEAGAAMVRAIDRIVYDRLDPAGSAALMQQELLLLP